MGNKQKIVLTLLFLETLACARPGEDVTVTLYQVGRNGVYCLSITPDDSGCVSGVDDKGNTINVLDFIKGKKVEFENLSDSPHDMKFTGANAEDLPAQAPGADTVDKKLEQEDLNKQKITCSFHGDQLGVGYRVPDVVVTQEEQLSGHKNQGPGAEDTAGEAVREADPPRKITKTGMVDVSKEILSKGAPKEVGALVAARPELINPLVKERPDLAKDLFNGGVLDAPKMIKGLGFPMANAVMAAFQAAGSNSIEKMVSKGISNQSDIKTYKLGEGPGSATASGAPVSVANAQVLASGGGVSAAAVQQMLAFVEEEEEEEEVHTNLAERTGAAVGVFAQIGRPANLSDLQLALKKKNSIPNKAAKPTAWYLAIAAIASFFVLARSKREPKAKNSKVSMRKVA